jgi:hypothetical protein
MGNICPSGIAMQPVALRKLVSAMDNLQICPKSGGRTLVASTRTQMDSTEGAFSRVVATV